MAVLSPRCKNNSCANTRWPNDSIFIRQHLFHSTFFIAIKLHSTSFDAIQLARQGAKRLDFPLDFLLSKKSSEKSNRLAGALQSQHSFLQYTRATSHLCLKSLISDLGVSMAFRNTASLLHFDGSCLYVPYV